MKKDIVIVLALFLLFQAPQARGQQTNKTDIPRSISYQGMISQNGTPTEGTVEITVSIYADALGTNKLWSQTFSTNVANGVFNLMLGSTENPLPSSQVLDRPLWLGVQVKGDEFQSLTPLTSTPYALNVSDSAITTSKIVDNAVTTAKIADRSITWNKMGTDYVPYLRVNGAKVNTGSNSINFTGEGGLTLDYDSSSYSILIHPDSSIEALSKKGYQTLSTGNQWSQGGDNNVNVDPELLGSTTTGYGVQLVAGTSGSYSDRILLPSSGGITFNGFSAGLIHSDASGVLSSVTDYVKTDPSTVNEITPTSDFTPLIINNGNGTYTNSLQWWESGGDIVASVDHDGQFFTESDLWAKGGASLGDPLDLINGVLTFFNSGSYNYGTLQPQSTLTGTRAWTLPDASGTVALTGTGGGLLTAGTGVSITNSGGATTITNTGILNQTASLQTASYRILGTGTIDQDGIATTPTAALTLENATAATSGTPQQISPYLDFYGNAYATANEGANIRMYNEPINGSTVQNQFVLEGQVNSGMYSNIMSINTGISGTAGALTLGNPNNVLNMVFGGTAPNSNPAVDVVFYAQNAGTSGGSASGGSFIFVGGNSHAGGSGNSGGGMVFKTQKLDLQYQIAAIIPPTDGGILSTTSALSVGSSSSITGHLALDTSGSSNIVTFVPGTPTADRTLTAPDADGIIALTSVAGSGTGASSFTANMPVLGGTTSTGALQSVATTNAVPGSSLMAMNGTTGKPTWQQSLVVLHGTPYVMGAPFGPGTATNIITIPASATNHFVPFAVMVVTESITGAPTAGTLSIGTIGTGYTDLCAAQTPTNVANTRITFAYVDPGNVWGTGGTVNVYAEANTATTGGTITVEVDLVGFYDPF